MKFVKYSIQNFFVGICMILSAHSQTTIPDILPPSPEMANLFKNLNFGVDHASGMGQITIPIYEVKSGSLSVPVTINYNAGGRMVFDVTGPIGLGWSLNAGGAISRVVYGAPDDEKYFPGTAMKPTASMTNATDYDYLASVYYKDLSSAYDTQYDIFSFVYPGNSGKFVFNRNVSGNPVIFLPYQPLQLSYPTSGSIFPSGIIDDKGVTYAFNNVEHANNAPQLTVTSKLLTSIISADKADTIFFTYSSFTQTKRNFSDQVVLTDNDTRTQVAGQVSRPDIPTQENDVDYTIQRLTTISFREGKVKFLMSGSTDRIQYIQVLNLDGNIIRTVEFQSSVLDVPFQGATTEVDKLDKVLFKDINANPSDTYTLEYNNVGASFSTKDRDYWGFLNNTSTTGVNTFTVPSNSYIYTMLDGYRDGGPSGIVGSSISIVGGNRTANTPGNSMLKKITYPTGGSTEFTYEQNRYQYGVNDIRQGGGLRVAQTKTIDGNGGIYYKTYTYGVNSSGYGIIGGADFSPSSMATEKRYFTNLYLQVPGNPNFVASYRKRTYNSEFNSTISDAQTNPIFYQEVTEYNGTLTNNLGKTVYDYSGGNQYITESFGAPGYGNPSLAPWQHIPWALWFVVDNDLLQNHISNYDLWKKIKLYNTSIFKNNGDNTYSLLKSVYNNYTSTQTGTLTGLHLIKYIECGSTDLMPYDDHTHERQAAADGKLPIFLFRDYTVTYGKEELSSTSETDYTGAGSISKTTNYTNNNNLYPVTVQSTASNGDVFTNQIKYPADFVSDPTIGSVSQAMVNANMINYPIEKITLKASQVLSGTKTIFNNWGTVSVPHISPQFFQSKTGSNGYENRVQFYGYDGQDNLLSVSKTTDAVTSYIWGFSHNYPLASVVNANSNEIFSESFEEALWPGMTALDNTRPHTGKYSARIDNPSSTELTCLSPKVLTVALTAPTKYKFSGWVYSTGPSVDMYLFQKRAGETAAYTYINSVSTTTTGKWVFIEQEVIVPADVVQLSIRLDNNSAGSVWYDDIRLHPSAALMTTYTYDRLIGMTSQSDVNNKATYYEYDLFGRLKLLRDQDRNIIKKICYNYAGQPENCDVFNSNLPQPSIQKLGCTGGQVGTFVTYPVPVYTSYSQASANTLAQNDINANGQSYANSHGTCITPPLLNLTYLDYRPAGTSVSLTLINQATGVSYNYTIPGNHTTQATIAPQFPAGNYNVTLSVNGGTTVNYLRFYNYIQTGSSSLVLTNISVQTQSDPMVIVN